MHKFTVAANDCAVAEIRHRTVVHDGFLSRLPLEFTMTNEEPLPKKVCVFTGEA